MGKLVCENCGGGNIETKSWVDVNTDKVMDDSGDGDSDDNWCRDCEQHLLFVPENEFVKPIK